MRTRVLLGVALASFLAIGAGGIQASPPTPSDAAEDVRLLGAMIQQVHPAPFRHVSRARFRSQVDRLARRAGSLDPDERLVGLLRLVALLGPHNGHTGIFPLDPGHARPLHLYPVRLYAFSDGLFVVGEAGDAGLTGTRLVAVAGVPVDRVLERVEPLVPRDNVWFLRGLAPHYLLVAEVLAGLGISERVGPLPFTFERSGGERVDVELTPVTAVEYRGAFADPAHGHYPASLPSRPRPFALSALGRALWSRTLENGRAVYIGYNSVVAPPPAELRKATRLVRRASVRRVVVDLRWNGGGDNTTYSPLLSLLRSRAVDRPGRLFLLTGRATFSAAANLAADVERRTRAVVVGEPTGGGVETYGDTVPVLLPSTGLYVHIAAEYHERRRTARDRRLAVFPDVPVAFASADFFAGRDPILERALVR